MIYERKSSLSLVILISLRIWVIKDTVCSEEFSFLQLFWNNFVPEEINITNIKNYNTNPSRSVIKKNSYQIESMIHSPLDKYSLPSPSNFFENLSRLFFYPFPSSFLSLLLTSSLPFSFLQKNSRRIRKRVPQQLARSAIQVLPYLLDLFAYSKLEP